MRAFLLASLAAVTLVTGCQKATPPVNTPAPVAVAPKIANLPARLNVKQRSTTVVPGSDGKLSVTVDDVTAGQTMVSVLDAASQPIMGPVSMSEGKSATFTFAEHEYAIAMEKLDNALIGEDYVTLVISDSAAEGDAAAESLTEQEKIERLIIAVEALEGATFVRNGTEHTPAEAAEHLRLKLGNAGNRITTAEQFIDHLASKSSISGDEYTIRMADGKVINAGDFLRAELANLEPTP